MALSCLLQSSPDADAADIVLQQFQAQCCSLPAHGAWWCWARVAAGSDVAGGLTRVATLLEAPELENSPAALLGVLQAFAGGAVPHFHVADGSGYQLLRRGVVQVCVLLAHHY